MSARTTASAPIESSPTHVICPSSLPSTRPWPDMSSRPTSTSPSEMTLSGNSSRRSAGRTPLLASMSGIRSLDRPPTAAGATASPRLRQQRRWSGRRAAYSMARNGAEATPPAGLAANLKLGAWLDLVVEVGPLPPDRDALLGYVSDHREL